MAGRLDGPEVGRVADVVRALRDRFQDADALLLFTTLKVPSELRSIASDEGAEWIAIPRSADWVTQSVEEAMVARAEAELQRVRRLVIVSSDFFIFRPVLDAASRLGVHTVVVADEDKLLLLDPSAAKERLTTADLLAERSGGTDVLPDSSHAEHVDHESAHSDFVREQGEVEREHVAWLDDDPVDIDADELGRQGVATALEDQLRTLVTDYPQRSFLVHIDGPWGAGKSTLMRFVQECVIRRSNESGAWLVVSYDAWRQSKAGPP